MKIMSVNNRNINIFFGEKFRKFNPAESPADYNNFGLSIRHFFRPPKKNLTLKNRSYNTTVFFKSKYFKRHKIFADTIEKIS